jgi:hypothetical protein
MTTLHNITFDDENLKNNSLKYIMSQRHNIRFFDEEKIPSKEMIEHIIQDSHDFVPHKNNLIQIEINIWGPEHAEEKEALVLNTVCGPGKEYWRPGGKYHNNFKILKQFYDEWRYCWLNKDRERFKKFKKEIDIDFNEQVRAPYLLTFTKRDRYPTKKQLNNNFHSWVFNYADKDNKGYKWYLNAGIHGYALSLLSVNEGLAASFCKCYFATPNNYSKILQPIAPNGPADKIAYMLGIGYRNKNVDFWGQLNKSDKDEYIFWK